MPNRRVKRDGDGVGERDGQRDRVATLVIFEPRWLAVMQPLQSLASKLPLWSHSANNITVGRPGILRSVWSIEALCGLTLNGFSSFPIITLLRLVG